MAGSDSLKTGKEPVVLISLTDFVNLIAAGKKHSFADLLPDDSVLPPFKEPVVIPRGKRGVLLEINQGLFSN
jgi:hypothetical protein